MSDRHMYEIQSRTNRRAEADGDEWYGYGHVYASSWFPCFGADDHDQFVRLAWDYLETYREEFPPDTWELRLVARRRTVTEKSFTAAP